MTAVPIVGAYRQYDERLWRPYHPETALFLPIGYDGITESGLHVLTDPRRPKRRGIVLNVYECRFIEPGDSIVFYDGRYNDLRTASGENLGIIHERDILGVLDDDGIPRMIYSEEKLIV